jgi:hypothetical protein
MKRIVMSIGVSITLLTGVNAQATAVKRLLKGNMTLKYLRQPKSVNDFLDMFSDGILYGRFRTNSFIDKPQYETSDRKSSWSTGIGGSLIYKTAYFHGFGVTVGLYTSQNPWHERANEIQYMKGDKQVFDRYSAATTGNFNMNVLAQAYLEYKYKKSDFKLGRQIFKSRLTASNDIAMIPNTFEGVSYDGKNLPQTDIKLAYFTKEKRQDHTEFHDVIAYSNSEDYNTDGAVHKGLDPEALQSHGVHNTRLIVAQVKNSSVKNLKVLVNYTAVPHLLSSATIGAYYKISLPNSFVIVPGVRYMQQFDDGAGAIGGANLDRKTIGYTDPNSLNAQLYCARIDLKRDSFLWRIAYSDVANKGDIVAPWRGFPTGGFTRLMGQYNWYANTKTYAMRLGYNFKEIHINSFVRDAVQDFDDNKPGVPDDSNVVEWDAVKTFAFVPGLYLKLRLEYTSFKNHNHNSKDISYGDYRFGINYLF